MKITLISAVVFLVIFCLILLTRAAFSFFLNQASKNYKKLKKNLPAVLKSKKKYVKEEDELSRKREISQKIPRAHSAVKAEDKNHSQDDYEIIPSAEQEQSRKEMNQVEIVDLVKPIGFWTSMILGQKLTYLIQSAQTLNKRGNKGFWVSMIEAKDRAAGRQHGRR